MENLNWDKFTELVADVRDLHSAQTRLSELRAMVVQQELLVAQKRASIPPAFLDYFTNPILELRLTTEPDEPVAVPEEPEEPEVPVASDRDIVAFLATMNSAPSSVERVARTLRKFHTACKKYYRGEPFTWLDVVDVVEPLFDWVLKNGHLTVNDVAGNGTYLRDFILSFDPSHETRDSMYSIIGKAKDDKKAGGVWRPLPENAVTFSEMQDKMAELMQQPVDTDARIDDLVLLALFCHEDLGVFRPGEWINCRLGKPTQEGLAEPVNWLDLEEGKYYRYNSKTYKSLERPKRIVEIPTDILHIVALRERMQGDSLFSPDCNIEWVRLRFKSMFPGKLCTAQFLRVLHVSTVAMKLSNQEREQRAYDMDHSPATQASIYARYDIL